MILVFLMPALTLYLGFLVFPAIQAFYLSFFQTSGFGDNAKWIGLGNYSRLLTDRIFWLSVRNMLVILLAGGVAIFGFAFLFTVLLNSGMWGKKLFRAMIFMPNVIAAIAITTFWSFVFMPRYGLLTNILKSVGLDDLAKVAWTAPENIIWAMLVGLVWISTGFFTILILSGADKIPMDMVEAARLEGANNRQIFRLITLPMMWDVILITLVLWVVQAITVFEFPYAFGGPEISQNLYTPSIYLYIMGFGQRDPIYQLGYATAIGVTMFLMMVISVTVLRLVLRRDQVEY
ncbi:MAG: sugar ABC transporter permease [Paracoccaceae bacterium]|nr:sugar ABC transporter permease [Paracoccaceae bacterium]